MATLNVKNFPDEIYARLRELAEKEHRSVAQQVIHLLEQAVRPPARQLAELRGLGKEHWRSIGGGERYLDSLRDEWD